MALYEKNAHRPSTSVMFFHYSLKKQLGECSPENNNYFIWRHTAGLSLRSWDWVFPLDILSDTPAT